MASRLPPSGYILGLDVGDKRIGVAIASSIAKLPQPLDVISAESDTVELIKTLIVKNDVQLVVVGLPRNLQGEETAQSNKIRLFADKLKNQIDLPIEFADESLSSKRADELMRHNNFKNMSQDSLAACFILEEYLHGIEVGN
jgi:putative holliday junction resolvase